MKVLAGCEKSGVVRDAFRARGHDAYSCDVDECDGPQTFHIRGDLLDTIASRAWDMLIAFPPCTYLSSSGLHWNRRCEGRGELTDLAVDFVQRIIWSGVKRTGIENPVGCLSTRLRRPTQIIQPYQFGEDASKATCLWLWGLPTLKPTRYVEPRIIDGKKRWANQTDSGQNRLAPSEHRAAERARTYPGIADAMADQWGNA